MKKIIVAMLLGFLFLGSVACQAQQTLESCKDIGEIAHNLMTARQNGVPMIKLIENVAKGNDLFTEMIMDAYEKGQYSTEEYQEKAISSFTDYWYLLCLKSMKKGK